MLKDIYVRTPDDQYYNSNTLETNDPIESLLGKIRMLLYTRPGEVLGQPNLGINLEKYLFEFGSNNSEISRIILQQITTCIPEGAAYDINVNVNFVPGTVRDAAFIDIYIDGTRVLGIFAK